MLVGTGHARIELDEMPFNAAAFPQNTFGCGSRRSTRMEVENSNASRDDQTEESSQHLFKPESFCSIWGYRHFATLCEGVNSVDHNDVETEEVYVTNSDRFYLVSKKNIDGTCECQRVMENKRGFSAHKKSAVFLRKATDDEKLKLGI